MAKDRENTIAAVGSRISLDLYGLCLEVGVRINDKQVDILLDDCGTYRSLITLYSASPQFVMVIDSQHYRCHYNVYLNRNSNQSASPDVRRFVTSLCPGD